MLDLNFSLAFLFLISLLIFFLSILLFDPCLIVLHPKVFLHFSFIFIQNELLDFFFINELLIFFITWLFFILKFWWTLFLKNILISTVTENLFRIAFFFISLSGSFFNFFFDTFEFLVENFFRNVEILFVLFPWEFFHFILAWNSLHLLQNASFQILFYIY